MNARRDWVLLLSQFTERNAGRRTRLEINDPELGTQVAADDFPLRGVAYDSRDGRVEIMVGEEADAERRLTHTVSEVTGVELLRSGGVDQALCVEHGGARTLLFVR